MQPTIESLIEFSTAKQQQFFQASGREWLPGNPQVVLEYISHTIEELIEARQEIPERKFWFRDATRVMDREALLEELVDSLLFLGGTFAVAGFSPEDVERALHAKITKNQHRRDHLETPK